MWPNIERRRSKRYAVNWDASLRCDFPDTQEIVQVKIDEVSLKGARLSLAKLQMGRNHLMVGNEATTFELSLQMPEGDIRTLLEISWYNWDEESRSFSVGVEFLKMEEASEAALRHLVRTLG